MSLEDIELVAQVFIYLALSDDVLLDNIPYVPLLQELLQLSFSEITSVNS